MNKKKIIVAVIVLAIVVSIIGGMLAYFTNTTQEVTNTFTVGDNVSITLTEPTWTSLGQYQAQGMSIGNTVSKDPTVTNVGTNDAFIFVKVEVACTTDVSPATPKEIFTYTPNSGWYLMTNGSCSSGKLTRIYAYGTQNVMTVVSKNDTAVIFNSVTVNPSITGEETGLTGNKTVDVKAYAIQSDGINVSSPTDVWTLSHFS